MSEVIIPTEREDVLLRGFAHSSDDQAYFELLQASAEHLKPFCSQAVEDYPTLNSVKNDRISPTYPHRRRFGIWQDHLLEQAQMVGSITLTERRVFADAEIGYWLGEDFTGRGYATIAARALARYRIARPEVERVVAYVHPNNSASQAVLERAGFSAEKENEKYVFFVYNNRRLA